MYKNSFGTKGQISFDSPEDYYEFLGFLCRDDGTTRVVWEDNEDSGAWADEGRIHFYVDHPASLRAKLGHTIGTGNIVSRVNCNEFVEHIAQHHAFTSEGAQDVVRVSRTIPREYRSDFYRGRTLAI